MAASATERARATKQKEMAYKLTSRCQGCDRPIVPGQTWKFTPDGGKVHYHCAEGNPETMNQRLSQEGKAIAHRLHPGEFDVPVSAEYFDFKLYQDPEAVIPGWSGMLPQEKQRAKRQLFRAYMGEAQRILGGSREENPAHLDLSWLQEGDTFAPDFGGQALKQQVQLYRNSDGRELTVAVEDVLQFNSDPVLLATHTPFMQDVGIWATPIVPGPRRRGFLRDSRYSLVFEGVPGYAYGEKWRLRHLGVENPSADYREGHYVVVDEDYKILSGPHRQLHTASRIASELAKRLRPKGHRVFYMDASDYAKEMEGMGRVLSGTGNPAGPTFAQASAMAHAAGAKIGDTSGFEPWLTKAGLAGRSPHVVALLRAEFWRGVEGGQGRSDTASFAYKGTEIHKVGQGYRVALDPDSEFEDLRDAKRFVDAQRRNPSRADLRTLYSLLDWKALNFGFECATSEPTMADVDTLAAEQTTLKVPTAIKRKMLESAIRTWGASKQHNPQQSNPFDYEASAREFGMNIGKGRSASARVVKGWMRRAQKKLDAHREWLRSKGYGDDGVAEKMESTIRWWEIALQEYSRARRAT